MPSKIDLLLNGPVVVLRGKHKGRIGMLDDSHWEQGGTYGIVYFAPLGFTEDYAYVKASSLEEPDSNQLLERVRVLTTMLDAFVESPVDGFERIELLHELVLVERLLVNRYMLARLNTPKEESTIFLSHSSKDKPTILRLAIDLTHLGHSVWLDEWRILPGDSIPASITRGLEDSRFVVVALSKSSTSSNWVEKEWQSRYWDEVSSRKVSVIPILLEDCKVPTLLKTKKYVDFRLGYSKSLRDLSFALSRHSAVD